MQCESFVKYSTVLHGTELALHRLRSYLSLMLHKAMVKFFLALTQTNEKRKSSVLHLDNNDEYCNVLYVFSLQSDLKLLIHNRTQ